MRELLSFDWCGKMAHFRKFYSNASALSHTIPPRTTLIGLLASIVELPRDSYYVNTEYEVFDHLRIGIQLAESVRKITQKFNYLKIDDIPSTIDGIDRFRGYENRKQVSTEIIIPTNIREIDSVVRYRIYVGFPDIEHPIFTKLKANLEREYYPFGISLGTANMLGYIERPLGKEPLAFQSISLSDNYLIIATAIDESKVETIDRTHNFSIEHDLFPFSFTMSKDAQLENTRIAHQTKSLLYATDGQSLRLKVNSIEAMYYLPSINQHLALL